MILVKPYLTFEGCAKKCAFERAYSKTHTFRPVRFLDGHQDSGEVIPQFMAAKRYTWRIEKTKRL